jgi:AraC-like DNA-binding protein
VCMNPAVGFHNRRQFERAFRQLYGCTPSQYREWALERRLDLQPLSHSAGSNQEHP